MKNLFILLLVLVSSTVYTQIQHEVEGDAVIDGKLGVKKAIVDPSAAVEIQSTNEGILIPRMTSTERAAIASPAKGLLVFDNSTNTFWFHNGTIWTELKDNGASSASTYWASNGNDINNTNVGQVGIGLNAPTASLSVRGIVRSNHLADEAEHVEIWHGGANGFINSVGDGNLDFRHDNNTLMSLTDQGYLGLGTIVPNNLLHLKSGHLEIDQGDIRFTDDGGGLGFEMDYWNGQLYLGHNTENSTQWNFLFKDNGNFGIGTTNPQDQLHIKGDGHLLTLEGATSSYIQFYPNLYTGGRKGWFGFPNTTTNSNSIYLTNQTTDGALRFRTNNLDRLFIKNNGFIGIGTIDPLSNLHIGNNGNLRIDGNEGTTTTFNTYAGSTSLKNNIFQIDPNPGLPTSSATVRLFRSTTASETNFMIFKGNNTTEHNHLLRGNGDSYMSLTGDVGIGTTDPKGYKLAVKGNIGAEEIEVRTNYWADYVFDVDYELLSLEEVESYINKNGHLPDVPSEEEALEKALNLGDMDVLLLQKVEELTLYTIEQNKLIKEMRKEIDALKDKK